MSAHVCPQAHGPTDVTWPHIQPLCAPHTRAKGPWILLRRTWPPPLGVLAPQCGISPAQRGVRRLHSSENQGEPSSGVGVRSYGIKPLVILMKDDIRKFSRVPGTFFALLSAPCSLLDTRNNGTRLLLWASGASGKPKPVDWRCWAAQESTKQGPGANKLFIPTPNAYCFPLCWSD